jgi:type IV pilus assembly protein PilC
MKNALPASARSAFFRQLAAATRCKLPLEKVMTILCEDQTWFGRSGRRIEQMAGQISAGRSLPEAMSAFPEAFEPETVRMLQLAEAGGLLAPALDALAADACTEDLAGRAVRRALAWPLTVLATGMIMLGVMNYFVIPHFQAFYASFGAALPAPTRALILFSHATIGHWWVWIALLLLAGAVYRRDPAGRGIRGLLQDAACWLPFVRRYVMSRSTARLVNWLYVCRDHPIVRTASLAHLRATSTTPRIRRGIARVERAMADGLKLSDALSRDSNIPKRIALFARLGEALHDFEEPFAQLKDFSEAEELDSFCRFERGLIISLYIIIGLAIGCLVMAVYMPIFHLGSLI